MFSFAFSIIIFCFYHVWYWQIQHCQFEAKHSKWRRVRKINTSSWDKQQQQQHKTKNDWGFVYFYRLPIAFSSLIKSIEPKMFFSVLFCIHTPSPLQVFLRKTISMLFIPRLQDKQLIDMVLMELMKDRQLKFLTGVVGWWEYQRYRKLLAIDINSAYIEMIESCFIFFHFNADI